MRRSILSFLTVLVALAMMTLSAPAAAHDEPLDDGVMNSADDTHVHDQHGGHEGHLPGSQKNVSLVGQLSLKTTAEGRISDVAARGNYAYLGAFYEPNCQNGGVYVVDISNPSQPKQVAFIRAKEDTYVGEGVQVMPVSTASFKGDLLVHNNEICGTNVNAAGGISLVDVTNPKLPKTLTDGWGDFTNADGTTSSRAHQSHSAFAWTAGSKAYAVFVDNEEGGDVDIADITDPRRPVLISETDLNDYDVAQPDLKLTDSFHHDVVVKKIGRNYVMLVSYWDGGYVLLNVNDPARPRFLGDTEYDALDPERLERGQKITPEGNGHQAEFTRDNSMFIATDEDFAPYRAVSTITSGDLSGYEFQGTQGTGVPQIGPDLDELAGPTLFVGGACDGEYLPSAPSPDTVAVVERGVCSFTEKVENVSAAGYAGGIVFNRTGDDGCDTLLTMLADGDIPFVFVGRSDGFRILGAFDPNTYTCNSDGSGTSAPPVGTAGASVKLAGVYDGWGYVHLYDRDTLADLGTYAIPEAQDPAYAKGFGDLSVHEVATDPDRDLAYFSYYAGGFRVAKYSAADGIEEVGHYIDANGNNFWGVEVHKHPNGQKYVLASDRDSGLWIFQYTGP